MPRCMTTTGSALPCAWKIGVAALAALRSRATTSAIGSQVDSATIPASVWAWHRPAASAIAPPCEKPASTIRPAGTPRWCSRAISASTAAIDARTPASSWGARASKPAMSYHARIGMPLLIVTGRTGACGNTKRSAGHAGSTSSGTIGAKSWPSAPRPCSQVVVGGGLGGGSGLAGGRVQGGVGGGRRGTLSAAAFPASWRGGRQGGPATGGGLFPGRQPQLVREEGQGDRGVADALAERGADAVAGVHAGEQQDRLGRGGGVLQRGGELARLPRRHARIVLAGGHQHGRV